MRYVESCAFAPGDAIGGGGSRDVIDTGFDDPAGGRIYIARHHAEEMATLSGFVRPQALAAVEEERDALRAEVDRLTLIAEEADALRQAIAFTLERGIVTGKQNTVQLRHKPSMTRIDLGKALV
jgi:hypothetical protein